MKKLIGAAAMVWLFANATSANENANVIYGDDNRLDLYAVKDSGRRALADSTVLLILKSDLVSQGDTTELRTSPYSNIFGAPLCSTERFRDQDSAGFCSGFLIAPDKIATAGHCVATADDCAQTRFVFGFSLYSKTAETPTEIASTEVYACKKLIAREEIETGQDYAVVELDRPVTDHAPLALRTKGTPAVFDQLMVIGHPSGLPTKIADDGHIRSINTQFITASLDTYGGNSGSAVFNTRTNEVEGILVRGEEDFVTGANQCLMSKRCGQDECRGEDVTRISFVLPYVTP